MSLLLDALKKAAEQKAEKSRAEQGLETSAADATETQADADTELSASDILSEDETDIDLTDHDERLAGMGRAARRVSQAMRRAPRGRKLPWHRVVNARGEVSRPPLRG